MSQENIKTLHALYEAINRGDWDAAFRDADPNLEMKTADRMTRPGTFRGPQEIRRFFEDLLEPFEDVVAETEKFFERDNHVLVFVILHSRPRGSSATMEIRIAHLWTMRDGKIVRCELFPVREEALEALGLSEQDVHADS
jgi:ketosteroid isomerase-like protein